MIKKGDQSVVIVDSYLVLNKSLDKLGKDFGVETLKGIFPYKLV